MKNNGGISSRMEDHLIAVGIGLAILYWVANSWIDDFVFHEGRFLDLLLFPGGKELWVRLFTLLIFAILIAYYKASVIRRKQIERALQNTESRFSGIADITADAIIMVDKIQMIVFFNKGAENIFGYQASEVMNQPLDRLLPPLLAEAHRGHIHAFEAGTERARLMGDRGCEISGRRKDGTVFPAEASIAKWNRNGETIFTAIVRDITEGTRAEETLRAKTDQLQSITDAMTTFLQTGNWQEASTTLLRSALSQTGSEYGFVGAVVEGPVLRILAHEGITWDPTVNREFYENTMKMYREKGFLEFTHFNNLFGRVVTSGQTVIANDPAADPRSGGLPPGHPPLRHFLGVPIIKETQVVGIIGVANRPNGYSGDEQKTIEILTQAAGVLYDSYRRIQKESALETERTKTEETIRQLAYYDPLTSLPNRTLFRDQLQQALFQAQQEKKPVALLLMDLDRFKEINDTLGHHRGDLILQQVALRLKKLLRPTDTIARLGGDEFGMLLPIGASEDAVLVARKIQKALDEEFEIEGLPIAVEISIGIAIAPDHGENPDSIIQRADVAMYAAKKDGLGFSVYNPQQDQHSPRQLALMGELRRALEKDQLFLHYQPKIDLRSGRTIGVEALVRWQHPEMGTVPPVQFIPLAEQTALIKPLTSFIFGEALRQRRAWSQSGIDLHMAVNLSARSLHDPQLPHQLKELLQACGETPDRLEVEITESAIMVDPARALQILTELSRIGTGLSIDDFGTGYSSLAYLRKLPIDTIKIDKAFVINMTKDQNDATIVRSTIDLGHNLGLKVIAEGVENKETYNQLIQMGCDIAQGYYMCRPIPADEFTRWIRESPFTPPPFH